MAQETRLGCIFFYSYIKPQRQDADILQLAVVYSSIPTSNHNVQAIAMSILQLYILLFLHQTTTSGDYRFLTFRCIFFYSYIKPQPEAEKQRNWQSCIFFYSYIKPQQDAVYLHYRLRCIFFYSYIKPQRYSSRCWILRCCIFFYSYIKPQPLTEKTS